MLSCFLSSSRIVKRLSCHRYAVSPVFFLSLTSTLLSPSARPQAAGGAPGFNFTGLVLDPSGAVVVNCPITLQDLSSGVTGETSSTAGGVFSIVAPARTAKLTVTCQGFAPQSKTVTSTEARHPIVFHLKVADVVVTLDIGNDAASVELDQSATQEAETLSSQEIAVLPVLDQDYVTFMSRFLDASATGTQGATLVVNGVEGGNFYQAPSAIKQLQVNQDQYSPAYATAGRGRLSLITSSGTKALHGSVSFALREHGLDATPDFSPVKPPEDREDYQATLTGPVHHLPQWQFAVSGQLKKDEQYAVINAITPDGPDVAPFPTPYYRDKVGGSLFFDNGSGRQFTAALGRTDEVHHNSSVGGLALPSIAEFSEYTGHFLDLQYSTLLSKNTLNQVRVALGQEALTILDTTGGPQQNVAGAFISGSEQATHTYRQYLLSGNEMVATSHHNDVLRVGLDIPELSVHTDNDQTDRDGIFQYASLQTYQAAQPDLFTVTEGNGLVRFTSLSAALFIEDTHHFGPHLSLMSGARYYFQNVYHNRPTHIAPRAEAAFTFGKNSHTVLRVGAGMFYDRLLTTNLAYLLQFNGVRLSRYIAENPPPVVTGRPNVPPSFVTVSPAATLPYLVQWSAALEQQLARHLSISAQANMNAGVHQLRMRDTNAPVGPAFAETPNPALGQILSSESEGHAHSDALDVFLKVDAVHGFTQQLRYRLSHSFNDTDGFAYVPANSYAPEADASVASYDQRHNLSLLSAWPLPWKFNFGTVLSAGSGLPFDELAGFDLNHDGTPNDRPAGVARNSLRGAAQVTLDSRLGRDFLLGGKKDAPKLALSFSAFNVTNHPNFITYEGVVTSPAFGRPITAAAPRQMQLNAVLSF